MPKTLNSLMQHLRENGISIAGSAQKRKLKNLGYYHGYKGYRFVRRSENKLPLDGFSQIASLNEFDMQIKALLYPRMMQLETALKNYTLEAVLKDSRSEFFDDIWRKSLTNYRSFKANTKDYGAAWVKRQRLRKEMDDIIIRNHDTRDVIRHFRDADKGIPIWALFEVMTMGNFGSFYDCLDKRVKTTIVRDIGMPTNLNSERILGKAIFTLKDLRNAIAHNGVILDVRFKTGGIDKGVMNLIKQEFDIGDVDFNDITDYVLLMVYLMRKMRFTKTECRQLLTSYQAILERYRQELPFEVFSKIIMTGARKKLVDARQFVSTEK